MPDTVTPGSEEFSANTDTVLITLRSEVDYEVETEYLLRLSVVDDNATPPQSGDLTVQVSNCYILNAIYTAIVLKPSPF